MVVSFVASQKKKEKDIHHVFLCALQTKISLGSSRDAHRKKSCEEEYDNLHAFVSDHRLMGVINPQMCYIREQSLAAAQTTGKTAVEKVFIAALFVLQCSFCFGSWKADGLGLARLESEFAQIAQLSSGNTSG